MAGTRLGHAGETKHVSNGLEVGALGLGFRHSIGGVFVIGVGMLALGLPLMLACAVKLRPFFRGETLNAETPILVPDTGQPREPACRERRANSRRRAVRR